MTVFKPYQMPFKLFGLYWRGITLIWYFFSVSIWLIYFAEENPMESLIGFIGFIVVLEYVSYKSDSATSLVTHPKNANFQEYNRKKKSVKEPFQVERTYDMNRKAVATSTVNLCHQHSIPTAKLIEICDLTPAESDAYMSGTPHLVLRLEVLELHNDRLRKHLNI